VVVIAHNEEALISDCLTSAIEACKIAKDSDLVKSFEIICVDAASNDATNSNVSQLPVRLVRIPERLPHGPGAARFVGYAFSHGNRVLFLDGDCTLRGGWLTEALAFLDRSAVAAVDGNLDQAIESDSPFAVEVLGATRQSWVSQPTQVQSVGQAIFRRDVLEKIGPHDPFLRGGEDRELSQRARIAGYSLVRMPVISVSHYWAGKARRLNRVTYLRSVIFWSYGDGQSIRKHWRDVAIRREQRARYLRWGTVLEYERLLLVTASILSLAVAMYAGLMWLLLLGGASSLAFLSIRPARREARIGYRESLFSSCVVIVRHFSLIVGLLKGTQPPNEYPLYLIDSVEG